MFNTQNEAGAHQQRQSHYIFVAVFIISSIFLGRWIIAFYYGKYDPYDLYYRLTVDLSDKEGRAVGIDVVVGCGAHQGRIIGGGSSFDVTSMDSLFYAWAIPDGHALSVRTSPAIAATDTCSGGTTENGKIPRDWLPFVIWYDNATDLSHGFGYATQDAYMSSRARIVFKGAWITSATAADYRAFKSRGPANLLPPDLSDVRLNQSRPQRLHTPAEVTPQMIADPARAWRNSGWLTCRGATYDQLSVETRSKIAKFQPQRSASYWYPTTALQVAIEKTIKQRDIIYEGAHMRPETPRWNLDRPKVYPQTYSGNLDRITPTTFADGSYHLNTMISPENLGFVDCGRQVPPPLEAAITGHQNKNVGHVKITCYINDLQVSKMGECAVNSLAFFENDAVIQQIQKFSD